MAKLDNGYTWKTNAATKTRKKGRAAGGTLVGVRKSLELGWKLESWKFGIIIGGLRLKNGAQGKIITTYNNVGVTQVSSEISKHIEEATIRGETILVAGDWNARVGNQNGMEEEELEQFGLNRNSQDKKLDPEGKKLLALCESFGMNILNGCIRGDREGRITHIGKKGSQSVIDLIITNNPEAGAIVEKLEVIPRMNSDHMAIALHLAVKRAEEPQRRETGGENPEQPQARLIWKAEKLEQYQDSVREKWSNRETKSNLDEQWQKLKETIWQAAEENGMVKEAGKGSKLRSWYDEECREARNEMWQALRRHLKERSNDSRSRYVEARQRRLKIYAEKKRRWQENKWNAIRKSRNMAQFWQGVNEFRPKKRKPPGEKVSEEDWLAHFKTLLGAEDETEAEGGQEQTDHRNTRPKEMEERDWLNGDITEQEFKSALNRLKKGKAPGEDGIKGEFLRGLPEDMRKEMLTIIRLCWDEGKIPESWRTARIYPIHKAGEENLAKNYRGISLLDLGYKVLSQIITARISTWLEKGRKLRESQAGFRPGRGTRDHIFVLNALIENRFKKKGGKLYTCFIDFRAAFDLIDREKLMKKLEDKFGVSGKILGIIRSIYTETWNDIITGKGISGKFKTGKGVRQGCPLSPVLFGMYLDDIDEYWEKNNTGGTVIGRTKIYALKYADDIAVVAETAEELAGMIRAAERFAGENNMEINAVKTKVMIFRRGGRRKVEEKWHINGNQIEVVNSFKYLGFWFTTRNSYETHIRKMAGKAQRAANACWGLLKRTGIETLRGRLYLYDTLAKSACLYGVEVWGWKRRETAEKLQARCVKMAMGLSPNTPDYIWKMEAGRKSVEVDAFRRVNKYTLETLRMEDHRWPKRCLQEVIRGIRNGNPDRSGKAMVEALNRVGDGGTIPQIWEKLSRKDEEENWDEIQERASANVNTLADQETQRNWKKIELSRYCAGYQSWKDHPEEEKYWKNKKLPGAIKEQWARIRCGSVGKSRYKGHGDTKCRACRKEEETLMHILTCSEVRRKIHKDALKAMERFEERSGPVNNWARDLPTRLKSHPVTEVCLFVKAFERLSLEPVNQDQTRHTRAP